jgi:hypothetical protein
MKIEVIEQLPPVADRATNLWCGKLVAETKVYQDLITISYKKSFAMMFVEYLGGR